MNLKEILSSNTEIKVSHLLSLVFVLGLSIGLTTGITISDFTTSTLQPTNSQESTDNQQNSRVMLEESMLEEEPTLGDSSAEITIVEYSDFGCPWCAEWAGFNAINQRAIDEENTLQKIKENYVDTGKARFIYKDYPVDQLHPKARGAHVAANCAFEQEEFWNYHDLLYDRRDEWQSSSNPKQVFQEFAADAGLDRQSFDQCLNQRDGSEVSDDISKIESVDGRLGTPTIYIGTTEEGFLKISGAQPYSTLQRVIDSELQG